VKGEERAAVRSEAMSGRGVDSYAGRRYNTFVVASLQPTLPALAPRFVSVDSAGRYRKLGGGEATQKVAYLTMMQVRAQIVGMAGRSLAIATTIAVRYSAVRVQGYDREGKKEVQILDYVQQQHRLFGHLARSYCFWIGGKAILEKLKDTERRVTEGGDGVRKEDMGDLHASLSALKSYCSGEAADGIEDCRKACGGHGYLVASGLPELLTTYLQNPTVEGDNHMLPQQVCKVLLKLLKSAMGGGDVEKDWKGCDCYYLVDVVKGEGAGVDEGEVIESVEDLLKVFKARAGALLMRLGRQVRGGGSERSSELPNTILHDKATAKALYHHIHITNNLPLVASLIAARGFHGRGYEHDGGLEQVLGGDGKAFKSSRSCFATHALH